MAEAPQRQDNNERRRFGRLRENVPEALGATATVIILGVGTALWARDRGIDQGILRPPVTSPSTTAPQLLGAHPGLLDRDLAALPPGVLDTALPTSRLPASSEVPSSVASSTSRPNSLAAPSTLDTRLAQRTATPATVAAILRGVSSTTRGPVAPSSTVGATTTATSGPPRSSTTAAATSTSALPTPTTVAPPTTRPDNITVPPPSIPEGIPVVTVVRVRPPVVESTTTLTTLTTPSTLAPPTSTTEFQLPPTSAATTTSSTAPNLQQVAQTQVEELIRRFPILSQ